MNDCWNHIILHMKEVEMRLICVHITLIYDRIHSHRWNITKLCMHVPTPMNIMPNIDHLTYRRVQEWSIMLIEEHLYPTIIHTRYTLKLCFTMRGMIVRIDALDNIRSDDLIYLNWSLMCRLQPEVDIFKYAACINDWNDIHIKPPRRLITKCHNVSMLEYMEKHYPNVSADLTTIQLERLTDVVNWNGIASKLDKDTLRIYAHKIDWNGRGIFSSDANAAYINWNIYSIDGLSDEDFIKRYKYINTEVIRSVCLFDESLLERHIR